MKLIHDPIARTGLLLVGFGAVVAAVIFVLIGTRFQHWLERWALPRHLSAASKVAATLCSSPRSIGYVIACSIAVHLLTIVSAWCCVMAIAAPVSFEQVLVLLPPVLMISTIPVSIAGWGVRESSMIAAFAFAGLAESDGTYPVGSFRCRMFRRWVDRRHCVDFSVTRVRPAAENR